MRRVKLEIGFLRLLADVAISYCLYRAYLFGVHFGVSLLRLNFAFLNIGFGIIGISLALRLIVILKPTVFFVLKGADIYASSNSDCNGLLEAVNGELSVFGKFSIITFVNKKLREFIHDVSIASEDTLQGIPAISTALSFFNSLPFNGILKFAGSLLVLSFDYVDECVIGYCCYKKDDTLLASISKSFVYFVKSADSILKKTFTVVCLQKFVHLLLLVTAVLIFIKSQIFSFYGAAIGYVAYKAISFIMDDAILEPLLMNTIVQQFIEEVRDSEISETEVTETLDNLVSAFPSIADLRDILGRRCL